MTLLPLSASPTPTYSQDANDLANVEFSYDRAGEYVRGEQLVAQASKSPTTPPTTTSISTSTTSSTPSGSSFGTTTPSTITSSGISYDASSLTNLQRSLEGIGFNRGIIVQGGIVTNAQGETLQGSVAVSLPDFLVGVAGAISPNGSQFALRLEVPLHNSASGNNRERATPTMKELGEAYDKIRETIVSTATNSSYTPEQLTMQVAGLYAMTTSVTSQALDSVYSIKGKVSEEDQRRVAALLEGSGVMPLLQNTLEMKNIDPARLSKVAPNLFSSPRDIVSDLADNLEK